jgi:hypothetical protein
MMNYTHTITTSLESNYENDDDVIEFLTFLYKIIFYKDKA